MSFYIKLHCKDIFALGVTSFSPAINGQSSLQWSQELFQAVCECRDLDMHHLSPLRNVCSIQLSMQLCYCVKEFWNIVIVTCIYDVINLIACEQDRMFLYKYRLSYAKTCLIATRIQSCH